MGRSKIEAIILICGSLCSAQAGPQTRALPSSIDDHHIVEIKGYIPALARAEYDQGSVPSSFPLNYITLLFKPSLQQRQQLQKLLLEQKDPKSRNYHRWLTPEEYGQRFGVASEDLDTVQSWLESNGFQIIRRARARNWIAFSGTAAQVERTFRTPIHQYVVRGERHFANATNPSVPAMLVPIISGLRGLDDFRPKPQLQTPKANPAGVIGPNYTNLSGVHYLAPDDIATIYDLNPLYASGIDGTGQEIVVVGQTDIDSSDIAAFRSIFNLSTNAPLTQLYGPDPGTNSEDEIEADLDLEWTGAVARNATIIYVYSTDVFCSVQNAVDDALAPVISMSYGVCEADVSAGYLDIEQQLAYQANAEGITWVASSGDAGAADCDWAHPAPSAASYGYAVDFPASIPEVTAVGGTEFDDSNGRYWNYWNGANQGSAVSYIPEKVWNDTASRGTLAASGGGDSIQYGVPWWQVGAPFSVDPWRELPDVSLTASADHDGYIICTPAASCPLLTWKLGGFAVEGGTSASTPVFAGMLALLNHYLVSSGGQAGLGNVNPNLYWLALNSPGVFHDTTNGNNVVPCTIGSIDCNSGSLGFSAATGYDRATGLGSVDASQFITAWAFTPGVQTQAAYPAGDLTLRQGQSVQIGLFTLVMQGDGNLVLYEQNGPAVWSSGTYGQDCSGGQCLAVFQSDGNFVVYNGVTPLWNSGTYGHPGAQLTLSAETPQLEIVDTDQSILWFAPEKFGPGNLTLTQGVSLNFGPYILVMQNDGNLVVYQGQYGPAVWSSGTYGQDCSSDQCVAVFQTDGNFVVYNGVTPLWSSNTDGNPGAQLVFSSQSPQLEIALPDGSILWSNEPAFSAGNLTLAQGVSVDFGPYILVMQNDGNLVLYQGAFGPAVWSTNTYGQSCGTDQCFAVFQVDGNFVVYNGATALWSSGTGGNPQAQLILSGQTPQLEIVGGNQSILWANY